VHRTKGWLGCAAGLAAFVLSACGSSEEQTTPEYPPMEETGGGGGGGGVSSTGGGGGGTEGDGAGGGTATPAGPQVQVVAGENTPLEGTAPTLRITAPRNGSKLRRGNVKVRAQLRNWELSPDGNHVHLIIDNEPYIPIRDLRRPLDIAALSTEHLGHDLAPGTHVVRMFPSRPQHESVKETGAFAWTMFHYESPTEGFTFDGTQPLLTFSRPKGCNAVGERILLDFFLTNVPALAADSYRVRYTIDSNVNGDITAWKPHFIENLQAGEHQVRLQLIGPDGQPVAGPFNDTTRTITIAAQCPEDHPHPAADAAPAAAEHGAAHGAEGAAPAATPRRRRGADAGP